MKELTRKEFYFIRHGETSWNVLKKCQGHLDIPLNEKGLEEAKQVAHQLAAVNIQSIVSSPLIRAKKTAELIHKSSPSAKLVLVDALKERNWGEFQGMESNKMYQIEEEELKDSNWGRGRNFESREEFKARIIRGINQALCFEGPTAVISHGRFFYVMCEVLGVEAIQQIPNAAIFKCTPQQSSRSSWLISLL